MQYVMAAWFLALCEIPVHSCDVKQQPIVKGTVNLFLEDHCPAYLFFFLTFFFLNIVNEILIMIMDTLSFIDMFLAECRHACNFIWKGPFVQYSLFILKVCVYETLWRTLCVKFLGGGVGD